MIKIVKRHAIRKLWIRYELGTDFQVIEAHIESAAMGQPWSVKRMGPEITDFPTVSSTHGMAIIEIIDDVFEDES